MTRYQCASFVLSVWFLFGGGIGGETGAIAETGSGKADKGNEGFVSVKGGRVWYRIVGAGHRTPLLVLHGGPGVPSDYLQPLEALADERPVVFYDQLGCGKSDRPENTELWRVERFVDELSQIREALGLTRVHLFGHSWGTMLALEYLQTQPKGIEGIVFASPCLDVARWLRDQNKLIVALPHIREVLERHEAAGTTSSDEYQRATNEFYKHHLCRLDPFPEFVQRAQAAAGWPVYHTMWGPNEFRCTGNLKDFDRTGILSGISVPTLFTCGKYDGATPKTTQHYGSMVPGSEIVVFQRSAHLPHAEEAEKYLRVLRRFLQRVDQANPRIVAPTVR